MKKKLIKKYILLSLPFICGLLLYRFGSYGIVSSLLFFVGGYMLIKNVFDYRVVRKNVKKCVGNYKKIGVDINDRDIGNEIVLDLERGKIDGDNLGEDRYKIVNDTDVGRVKEDSCKNKEYIKRDNINGLKSTRIYKKVRRKY